MAKRYVHTCVRVRDPEASLRFYGTIGFEPRGRLEFESAYNLYELIDGGAFPTPQDSARP
jgi:lactoylglutathione lyase